MQTFTSGKYLLKVGQLLPIAQLIIKAGPFCCCCPLVRYSWILIFYDPLGPKVLQNIDKFVVYPLVYMKVVGYSLIRPIQDLV